MRISDWSSDVCSSDLEGAGVGRRVRPRRAADRRLVDVDHLVEMFQPFHLVMRASDHARAVERPRGGGIESVDGERRLARAGNAGDAGEGAQRDLRIDIAQVIGQRALYEYRKSQRLKSH